MKIKKYRAATMPEIMNLVRKDLGPDAVILQSREVYDGGFIGMFKKKKLEVMAALDKDPVKKQPGRDNKIHTRMDVPNVVEEIKYLRKMMEDQVNQTKAFTESEYLSVYQQLCSQELDEEIVKELVSSVRNAHLQQHIRPTLNEMKKDMENEIAFRLNACIAPRQIESTKQVIQFVGPTGVGKTTTIAKIAATEMTQNKKSIAFITTDTYRIAAVEQLRTYAKILDAPLEVAYSASDYHQAVEKLSNYDLIFVDTAGRNFLDMQYVEELREFVSVSKRTINYLVLSLTAKQKDLLLVTQQFAHLQIDGLIFTKLDETKQYGSLLTLPVKTNISLAYLSNGQSVPDDLLKPDGATISKYLMGVQND